MNMLKQILKVFFLIFSLILVNLLVNLYVIKIYSITIYDGIAQLFVINTMFNTGVIILFTSINRNKKGEKQE